MCSHVPISSSTDRALAHSNFLALPSKAPYFELNPRSIGAVRSVEILPPGLLRSDRLIDGPTIGSYQRNVRIGHPVDGIEELLPVVTNLASGITSCAEKKAVGEPGRTRTSNPLIATRIAKYQGFQAVSP